MWKTKDGQTFIPSTREPQILRQRRGRLEKGRPSDLRVSCRGYGPSDKLRSAPLLSAPGEKGAPPATSAGPGGPEGHRRAGEARRPAIPLPPGAPDPGRASRHVRARTLGARRPGPSRPRHDPVTTPSRPRRRRAHPRAARSPPRDAARSHGSTSSRAAAPRTFPPHLRSGAALHLLARSARPVGARTDPPAAVTRAATAAAASSSSAQAPAASRGLHQVPSLVRAARRKCHQRPFRSAPHFRPEPQSPPRSARAAAAAAASRDWRGKPRESQTAPPGGRGRALLPLQSAGRAATSFPGFFPALHPSALGSSLPETSFPEGRKPVSASQGQCPKRRTALPCPYDPQYSPFLKASRRKLVVSESLSGSSRESALFSPRFFADADSSARGHWAALFSGRGLNIPCKFLVGNLAGPADAVLQTCPSPSLPVVSVILFLPLAVSLGGQDQAVQITLRHHCLLLMHHQQWGWACSRCLLELVASGPWVAQLVKCLPLAPVMIPGS
ncbi:nascent polypeptide-associated complex subunit alpha, muscle-specific form-like isoform X1 [Canis lupus familiaris]|uniref:nascent polypeptide-associated complex subunit alpha, muscle-specific form-like isoform X1 n=1 Tax=Canis lupus familiaris TaxID=9615 RepID=UPI0018F7E2EE|nr:nascent polypeptide-associated complex subunit alpha, muscle-specific form-like isoform X1 [Canis lupus familiaris]